MGYVALQHLVWGDGGIEPGQDVPADEPGRDYGAMVRLGQIAETHSLGDLSDDEVRTELAAARAELSKLRAAGSPAPSGPWLVPTDEERELLVDKGLDGEFTLAELDAALTPTEDVEGTAAAKAADAAPVADGEDDELPEGVTATGGGWYLLADGETKVHGRKALDAALSDAE